MSDQSIRREVVPGMIWAISKPFTRYGGKVGGRASIIKLAKGDLFVISPTPMDDGVQQWVDSIGKVRYLASPGLVHWLSLKAWKDVYPEAEVIGPQGLDLKAKDLKFDFMFTPDALEKTFGNNEIIAHYFPGYDSKEIAFLHVPSKSLLNADLAENLPANEAFSLSGISPTTGWQTRVFLKLFGPNNWLHNFAIYYLLSKDKAAMRRDAKVVSEWDFDRLIPCHGDVMETGAKKYWNDLYQSIGVVML